MQKTILCLVVGLLVAGTAVGAARPPLVDAAKNGDRQAVRALVQAKVDVNAADADGTTALHWVSYRDDVESANLLLDAGANVNAANDLGATPLWIACENGSAMLIDALLKAGANPNPKLLLGETPLMLASRSGKAQVVERLLAKGADVNARAARGQTALMWAVAERHPDVVKVLVAKGADVNSRSDVWNQVMAVPPHGVPLYNKAIPHGGDTALLFAARSGDLASAKHLVAAGANVNDADAWGVSATVLAAHSGFDELVEFLLERGAATIPRCRRMTAAWSAENPAPIRTRVSRPGRRRGVRRRTTTLRPSSSAPRRSGWRPASASPMSCGCSSTTGRMHMSCSTASTTPRSLSSRVRTSPTR